MGKIKLNPAVHQLTGRVGDFVYRELWGDLICGPVPDFSDRVLSSAQVAENNKYKLAGLIWRQLDASVKAAYGAWGKRLNKPPYALFNKNRSRPPEVESIDLSAYTGKAGEPIGVVARDLFDVARVELVVREPAGAVVERGAAVRSATDPARWEYQSTAAIANTAGATVEATAGNWAAREGNRIQPLATAAS
jgi:hypothetical protein